MIARYEALAWLMGFALVVFFVSFAIGILMASGKKPTRTKRPKLPKMIVLDNSK